VPPHRPAANNVPVRVEAGAKQGNLSRVPRDKSRPPRDIAVLGAGLTGLTTAWYLTRALPEARITIYEEQKRVGGWINTDKAKVKTPDGKEGTVLFEHAARMVKPQAAAGPIPRWDDLVFFDLVRFRFIQCVILFEVIGV
jgi:oxygen-dependent protoporphyrinogen oxidase